MSRRRPGMQRFGSRACGWLASDQCGDGAAADHLQCVATSAIDFGLLSIAHDLNGLIVLRDWPPGSQSIALVKRTQARQCAVKKTAPAGPLQLVEVARIEPRAILPMRMADLSTQSALLTSSVTSSVTG